MPRSIDPTTTEAVGTIKAWIRPDSTTPLPVNWVICDGSTIFDPDSPFDSGGGFTVIDFRNGFVRGNPSISNTSFPNDSNYVLGGGLVTSGGASNHSHNVGGSTDLGGAHGHNIGTNTAGSHQHNPGNLGVSGGGAHAHNTGSTGNITTCNTAGNCPIDFGLTLGFHVHNVSIPNSGAHNHTINTGSTASAGDHSHGGNTSNTAGHSHALTSATVTTEANLPPFFDLVYIMKIK